MAGQGVAPLDPTTAIGQVRGLVGDITYTATQGPVLNQGEYLYFSDAELSAFLVTSSQSVARAVGWAYMQLAAGAAINMASIATADLKADTTKTPTELRAIANDYFAQADAQDARDAETDFDLGDSGARKFYPGLRFPLNPEYVPVGSWPPLDLI